MPASFSALRWKESRDWVVSSMPVRSQTHCSPSLRRSMICRRVSSDSAWNQRAVRFKSFAIDDGINALYQENLIYQDGPIQRQTALRTAARMAPFAVGESGFAGYFRHRVTVRLK